MSRDPLLNLFYSSLPFPEIETDFYRYVGPHQKPSSQKVRLKQVDDINKLIALYQANHQSFIANNDTHTSIRIIGCLVNLAENNASSLSNQDIIFEDCKIIAPSTTPNFKLHVNTIKNCDISVLHNGRVMGAT
jgi:hypothetical protein